MSELGKIATALTRAASAGQVSVLATVVRTEGSTYRRIGARMVVLADGSHVGAVSAGCLETDLLLRAEDIRASGSPETVIYDTRSPDDLVWGLGLGCGGVIELLLEPLDPERAMARVERLRTIAESRRRSVLATVIRTSAARVDPGDQAVLIAGTAALSGLNGLDEPIRTLVHRSAGQVLQSGSSGTARHLLDESDVDVAYEVHVPTVRLCLSGAGPDVIPVVAAAQRLGWQVTVMDHRPAPIAAERWPQVDRVVIPSLEAISEIVAGTDCDATVVMNHHYERDLAFLAAWIDSSVPYLGVLGPRHRTEQMLATLAGRGIALDGASERIRAPVGLDLGAESPEEIALAIVAEIQAVHAGREAEFLSRRDGPIHGPVRRPQAPVIASP